MAVSREDIELLEAARKALVSLGERHIAEPLEELLEHLRLEAIGLR
jgi:hypothetical protein